MLMEQALAFLGVDPGRAVSGPVYAERVYMHQPAMCGGSLGAAERALSARIREKLRRRVGAPPSIKESPILVIFRERAKLRRLNEHAEMVKAIKRAFPKRKIVIFGDAKVVSLEEQWTLFYQTRIVVAPHGGGLSNILAMEPGSHVVEIQKYERDQWPGGYQACFQLLSFRLGLQHHTHFPVQLDDSPMISVRVDDIVDILRSIVGE